MIILQPQKLHEFPDLQCPSGPVVSESCTCLLPVHARGLRLDMSIFIQIENTDCFQKILDTRLFLCAVSLLESLCIFLEIRNACGPGIFVCLRPLFEGNPWNFLLNKLSNPDHHVLYNFSKQLSIKLPFLTHI